MMPFGVSQSEHTKVEFSPVFYNSNAKQTGTCTMGFSCSKHLLFNIYILSAILMSFDYFILNISLTVL